MTTKIAHRTKQMPRNRTDLRITELARNKDMRKRNCKDIIRLATWNVASWITKEQEIIQELEKYNIEICLLSETKKKGKGTTQRGHYLLAYSGVEKHVRAHAGVGILIHNKYINNISDIQYVDERIIRIAIKLDENITNLIAVYTPDTGREKTERERFYENLQDQLNLIPRNERIIIMGDLNGRVGNAIIPGIKQRFNEDVINESGQDLIDFCAMNELRINNTFFDHPIQHKITWSNTRGYHSMIDYVLSNREIQPKQIVDVRTLSSANVGSDHGLVLFKLNLKVKIKKPIPNLVEKINIEKITDPSTRKLYSDRLNQKLETNEIENLNIEQMWEKMKRAMLEAANEALGRRKVNKNRIPTKTPWFNDEVKELSKQKKKAFIKYKNHNTPEEYQRYKGVRNEVNREITKIKQTYWERYTKDLEHDLHGTQKTIWRTLQNQKKQINENVKINSITEEQWVRHFETLYAMEGENLEREEEIEGVELEEIAQEEIEETIKRLKNRKSPGPDEIYNELIKYAGHTLNARLCTLFNKILVTGKIPKEWKSSYTIPIFKKGDRKTPDNYRGITLLSTTLKLLTSILRNRIEQQIPIQEEQQGFRKNRSTTDAIFMIRQLSEKAIEYDNPVYLCFVDLTKAFDKIRKTDILKIMTNNKIPSQIRNVINDINTNNTTRIITDKGTTKSINIKAGIRQGDSLSPLLFNLIMDQIIVTIRRREGYKMGNKNINIICYADDAILIANNEDDLQKLLHHFNITAKKFNMEISTNKTKSMVIAKEPTRCKLEIEGKIIEQIMSFNYLGVNISSNRDLKMETQTQTTKAVQVAGALRTMVWRNRFMNIENKTRIYKAMIRPILTYANETRAETKATKHKMRVTEMRILRSIAGVTLRDRQRNAEIRRKCKIEDVVKWMKKRKKGWHDHVQRMDENRLAKICKNERPTGKRPRGRPPKRWYESWKSSSTEV